VVHPKPSWISKMSSIRQRRSASVISRRRRANSQRHNVTWPSASRRTLICWIWFAHWARNNSSWIANLTPPTRQSS
jgi:hypothetical protein